MTYNIELFGEEGGVRIVRVHLRGNFSFKDGSAVWETCRPEQLRCQVYYLDLAQVTGLQENGIAWLRLFLRWARESGCSVRIVNAPLMLRSQLARAGISVSGTALDYEELQNHKLGEAASREAATYLADVTSDDLALALSRSDESP